MDGDQNEFGSVHEGNVDIGPQTSNNLELNVEQNCCSPNVARASDSQSCPPAANVLSCDTVLGIGTEFESNDHAYRFYNKYARLLGFNVRKDWINRSKVHGQVVSRKFTCSQEGWKDKRDANVKKHRKETRSGCLAHMIVNRQPDGKYQRYGERRSRVCLLGYFQRQHFENPTFFYAIQLDVEDKVSNLFWADDNMVVDYDHFGDVICLDTTCRTNKDLRPFVQFLGVNHHKQPKAILTEQEAVIIEAVNTVLSDTNHCTCVWQLYENTLKYLSHVVKDAESFANDLRRSIYDPKDEEFTRAWEAMLEKYNLQQNEWLRWIYREREMGCFHLGEILSHKFRSYLNHDLDVLQFFKHFERVVDEQRYKEIEASEENEQHASDIYTPRAFEVFQGAYEKSLNVLYKANTFGHTRQYNVTFNSSDDTVVCSCMKFERVGCLCSHALKVLDHTNIKVVPSQYILDRWTGDARLGNLREIKQLTMQGNPNMVVASCYKDLCHRLLKLSVRASESMEAYQFSARQLDEVMVGVEKILALKAEEGQVITSSNIDANASENEPAEIFLNGHAIEDQDESNRANGGKDRRATSDRGYLTTMTFNGADSDRILNVEVSPPNTVVCISSPSSAYVSSHSASPNPILQGMYSFEANQVVHCMYEQTNHVLDHQSNSNTLQPPNIFSNQQDCPGQSQLLQEPIIQSTYHASMPCNNQMRQGIDLDIQNPHSSSFLLYDHRYRSSESA
uniref:Protein FAR1-RELATED SEQUENCE n=1 Tax=Glycine max TaxID=3847 RepID=K7N3N2_SOYBN